MNIALHDVTVVNKIITAASDMRYQGGAIPNNHNQEYFHNIRIARGFGCKSKTYWEADPNGVHLWLGNSQEQGRPIRIFLTTANPGASDKNTVFGFKLIIKYRR